MLIPILAVIGMASSRAAPPSPIAITAGAAELPIDAFSATIDLSRHLSEKGDSKLDSSIDRLANPLSSETPKAYLPVVLAQWPAYAPLCNASNDYCETWDTCQTAYGPLAVNMAYQAYPEDEDDYYYFNLSAPITVSIHINHFAPSSSNGDLVLYGPADGNQCGPRIAHFGKPGYSSMSLGPRSLAPGKYHIRVYTAQGFSTSVRYSLIVTYNDISTLIGYSWDGTVEKIESIDVTTDRTFTIARLDLNWVTSGQFAVDSTHHKAYLGGQKSGEDFWRLYVTDLRTGQVVSNTLLADGFTGFDAYTPAY